MIAQKLAVAIDRPEVCTAQPVNGYLNFFLNRGNFAKDTLQKVMAAPERWGSGNEGEGKTVVLDYSSYQYCQALPHRPPQHHHDRQFPVPHLWLPGLAYRVASTIWATGARSLAR